MIDASNGPGDQRSSLIAGGRLATVHVRGVALGRFALVDGRPPDTAQDAAEAVANFTPGTVPVLSRHRGLLLGYLDTLSNEGPDLHFSGTLGGWSDLRELIGRGRAVSIETSEGREPTPHDQKAMAERSPFAVQYPYFAGVIGWGMNLIGVALSGRPAARGSTLWMVEP